MFFRRQSFFLFIAILTSIVGCFLWKNTPETQADELFLCITMLVVALSFVFAFVAIFSFKKRNIQIILNNLNMIINVLLIGLSIYWLLNLSGGIPIPEKGIKLVLPAISVVALFGANFHIRKDERLVKSVDRFR